MKHKIYVQIILALFISVAFVACKDKEKGKETTTEATTTTDPTTTTMNPADMDAVKVAPNLYKVLADSMGIRLVEVNYKPGDSSAMHWHSDYAVYAVEGGTATFYAKDGSKMDNEMKAGMTLISPGEYHSVKNNGKTNIHVILAEVNRSGQTTTSPDATTDAIKVAPTVYKLRNDSLGIRVIEVTAKPGQSIAMHSHPDHALYVLEGGTTEFTSKDGKKTVVEMKKGMAMIGPAESHSAKNTGKTTLKALLVEVNKAQ